MTNRFPPFGKQLLPVPGSGVQVAIGPGAWSFQKRHSSLIMVQPDDASPDDFTWSSDGNPGLIHERGIYDDDRLAAMEEALLRISQGLWTNQVSLGPRCVGWPAHKIAALNAARIAGVLEFAAILGEAIARVHLAGKNANAPEDDDRGFRCGQCPDRV